MAATPQNTGRIFAIGDVHGCIEELQALWARLNPTPADRFIFLGDLVNRGPDSHAVVRFVRSLRNTRCLLGNHEQRLLQFRRSGEISLLKDYDWETLRGLDEEDWLFLENLDVSLEIPRLHTAFVHGGLLPAQPWHEQGPEIVCHIQAYDPRTGVWGRRKDLDDAASWQNHWEGPPFIICGHTPRPEVFRRPWSICIDTGCVYGGKLTAIEVETLEIIQQPAARNYAGKELKDG
ncbi:MAG: metallophosphoesterase [Opitutales bacterium]